MKDIYKIKEILSKKKEELQRNFNVSELAVFGSYVRGEAKKGSDLDLLVDFKKPISLLKLVRMENYLSELLKIKVDAIPKKDVRPELKKTIFYEAEYI